MAEIASLLQVYERKQAANQRCQHPPTAYGEARHNSKGEEAELGRFILGAREQIQRSLIRERPETQNDRVYDGQISGASFSSS